MAMHQLILLSVYLITISSSHPLNGVHHRSRGGVLPNRITRNAIEENILEILRPAVTQLEHDDAGQCVFVKSEEGIYTYASPGGSSEVCGFYVIAEPDQFVEFEFESFDLEESCSARGLVNVVDGWELNGQFFPGTKDHPISRSQRYHEFCDKKPTPQHIFKMSQNVGLIEFRVPRAGEGFRVRVRFTANPQPCNAVLQIPEGVYTLRNYGQRVNCTVSIIFPESFHILAASVGSGDSVGRSNLVETGILRQCKQNGETDYVEIRGGDGLDPDVMEAADDFCGIDSKPENHKINVACGNTAVRLVSSGLHVNEVTIAFDLLLDFTNPSLLCPNLPVVL